MHNWGTKYCVVAPNIFSIITGVFFYPLPRKTLTFVCKVVKCGAGGLRRSVSPTVWYEVLQRFKEERNITQTIQRRKANWIGHILHWNCLLKHVIEGNTERRIEVAGKWGKRHKQLVDDLKEKRGYWKFNGEVLDHTLWRTHYGRGYGPVIRHTTE